MKTIGIGISDPAKRKQQLIMRVKRKVAQAMRLIGTFGLGTKNGIVYGNDEEGEGFGVNRIRERREKAVVIAMGDELCERERGRVIENIREKQRQRECYLLIWDLGKK